MGHEVTIAGPAGDGMLPQNDYTHHIGGTHTVLSPGDSARINLSPTVIGSIRNFLKGRKFDVVHLHEPYLPFIGPAFLHMTDAVKVGTFHTWREGPHLPYIIGWPFLRYWNTKLQGRIAVSHLAEKTIHAYVPAKYRIIPNGVDFSRFACPAPPPERRINGSRHAGVRLVQEGATLMPVLDAHREGASFTAEQLLDYRNAKPPADEQEAIKRREVMRKARSKKKRPALLASLELRYLNHL